MRPADLTKGPATASADLPGLLRKARTVSSASNGRFTLAHGAAAHALMIRISSAGLAFASQAVLAHLMGQHEFGIFAFAWVWFSVLGCFANLGFGDSTIRFIPQLRSRGDDVYLRGYLRFAPAAAFAGSVLAGVIAVAAVIIARPFLDQAYVLPLIVMVTAVPLVSLQSVLEGVGRSYEWIVAALVPIYILRHGFLLLFMAAAVSLGYAATAVTALWCVALAAAAALAWQAVAIIRRLRGAVPHGARAYRPREWIRGSVPFTVLHGAGVLFGFTDVMVLSLFAAPAEVAVYFAATRVIQVANLIPYAARVAASHLFSAAHARGDVDAIQRLAEQMTRLTFAAAFVCLAGIAAGGEWLLSAFGDGFTTGYIPMLILAAGVIAAISAGPAEEILNMTGHGIVSAWSSVVLVALSIALNLALIIPFGVIGAAAATSILLAGRSAWLAYEVRRRLGVRTWMWSG